MDSLSFVAVREPDRWCHWIGAAIGAAAAIAGTLYANQKQGEVSSEYRDWAADQYARRYRITMSDMRAAGLNPILAYSQGPGSSPQANAPALQNPGTEAGQIISQAEIRKAQADQSTASAKQMEVNAEKQREEARLAKMKADDYEKVGPSDSLATYKRLGGSVEQEYRRSKREVLQEDVPETRRFSREWSRGDDIPKSMDPRLRESILQDRRRVMRREQNRQPEGWWLKKGGKR